MNSQLAAARKGRCQQCLCVEFEKNAFAPSSLIICYCDHSCEDHEDASMAPPARPTLPDKGGCPTTGCMRFSVCHLHYGSYVVY